jgi:cell division protein FtsN
MASKAKAQRGGFFLGMIIGLLVGVMIALGVALYVTKVPIPFVDKVPQRSQQQEAAEAERNKRWDPNAPLGGKPPARPADSAPAAEPAPVPVIPAPAPTPAPPAAASTPKAAASRPSAAASATPSASSKAEADALQFFVQVGAYARSEDAEQQRAKLAMAGLVGRITEREQAGRLVYRVRLGPFDSHDEATAVKQQAATAGYPDAALVRVPKNP